MRRNLLEFLLFLLALALLGCGREPGSHVADEVTGVADFEQSAFLRRHAARRREETGKAVVYRFSDPYGESREISLSLEPPSGEIRTVTLTWMGDSGASWSSIKKQFLADLLESTFSDVDYGEVSSYAMRAEQTRGTPAIEASLGRSGSVSVRVAFSGHELVLRLERRAGHRPEGTGSWQAASSPPPRLP